mmetsp:Transcript_45456/g.58287  ORF Transcript_45456/g.58287 Transcript_45456/m.58287 type:complete len:196 (-) Transcript_45456:161-748(-)
MMMFLLPFFLLLIILAGASECYFLHLEKGAGFSGNYEILSEFDLDSVDVKVAGPLPHRTALYTSTGLEEGSFSLEASDAGDQELCFTNKDIDTSLTLGFAFRADNDLLLAQNNEMATEENVKSMIQIANELTQGLDLLADHQEFMRVREDVHRSTVSGTNDRVLWWSFGEAVILTAMSIWQILYIRTFFETKRSI